MLKLAMLLNNAGEPVPETRYSDPHALAELSYTGLVLWETTSLSGVGRPDAIGSGEMRRWIEQQLEVTREHIHAAEQAGLQTYLTYDALSLASASVQRGASNVLCKNRTNHVCPGSDAAMSQSVQALEQLLSQLPAVDGVVLRFGDNDARRVPYLVGNDIYLPHCPRCSELSTADRIADVLHRFHELVVGKFSRRLIARAWNVRPSGMHDSLELAEELVDRLPGEETDDRFLLSFKFTEADFWRFQRWNPASLVYGQRPIVYELQCQREFEGKGGIPNWQVGLWRNGFPETPDEHHGLAEVSEKVNLAGLWAWVRGGGWGGPFVKNETWIDANVYAVPKLADDPQLDPSELAHAWITERLGVSHPSVVKALQQVLEQSADAVLKAFYITAFARAKPNPWHPNGDWINDDLIDAAAAWRMIMRLPDDQLDSVVREKQEAVEQMAHLRADLQHQITESNRKLLDPLVNTLIYAESLFEALRDLIQGLVAYRRYLRTKEPGLAEACRNRMLSTQSRWQHHTQRHGSLPGCATAFREDNLWEMTQRVLGEVNA